VKYKSYALHSFKALDDGQGTFEAIVAVFGNVDRGGDRIVPGAFEATLADWEAKGRPIPVIFSHDWHNLDAHVGEVLEAKELPEGLYVKGQLDLSEEFAARVWKKMRKGTLAEFSFAYDVVAQRQADEGKDASPRYVNELQELELYEVGPCLVGMNPETELLGIKAGARHTGKELDQLQSIHDAIVWLGAKCPEADPPEDTDAGDSASKSGGEAEDEAGTAAAADGKSRGKPAMTGALMELDMIEWEPLGAGV